MISVLVIAKNEEKLLAKCLESVQWADEIIVIDDESTDQTKQIALKYTTKVYTQAFNGFSEKRNFGLSKVAGDFLLCIDADERVLAPLKKEIVNLINNPTEDTAWQVSRRNIILGEEVKYSAFWPDRVIRLFKVKSLKNWQGEVHEQPVFEGSLGTLQNPLLHLTHRDIDSMVLKSLEWSNIDARLRLQAQHPPMSGWRFMRIMLTETWKQGVARRGFFNGTVGTIDALLQVFSLYLSFVKLWQLQRKQSLDDTYRQIDEALSRQDFEY
ncbi:hypothetical protein A2631_02960 [Candidatus Daviesbacteria bacterium RIFCSPHIGHO2_01_FULL_44_29]|uniref:Glycosyltransferase 2-like domain-containing protein n=1 Tax=Candidatus Daviesbacteria bacterium RIFCSPHIGHO2_02_FULL_43_12 TaxID=1797776 RepID=A0A1F5KKE3_9BACT|nr:MAG: hypothetical protein A2631_02960 [Candidatus Daviesbacteria bacterium RIFCSPHIGHO2_01_FULL_44_29]OGE41344.1 MAG: hypothetical protein A3D25_02355 [Candidatus Daviesbacteria bacterium RIFCSPHIGHO2_02_FULL_43_12]OGE69545.1 MAG: hypothetical protein A3B55_04100 [Candidatus Daviesbacteria bacterium RIFCSPLOWO2_01_FULL_43_15]